MNILAIIQLLLGVTLAFYGASILKSMPPLGGFILAGLLGIIFGDVLIPASNSGGYLPYIIPVGVGLVGAVLSVPLQVVIRVLSGSILGAIFGLILGYLIAQQGVPKMVIKGIFIGPAITDLQMWLMAIFAMVFGLVTIRYEDFMLYASTGFLGSLAVTMAMMQLGAGSYRIFSNTIFLFFFFITFGLFGLIWQNYDNQE